ncbi:protein translocase subunit SecD, partial [Patescibacteria group bacterium]|nr:protein translocase subunit SecD [Patescibacteria group bacterium]
MRGAKKLILTLLVLVLGVGAGLFAFPQMANSLLAKVPFLSLAVPERPFLLGLDLQGGLHLVYEADLSSISGGERDEAMEGLRDVIERRVNLFGVQEPVVQVEGTRLVVELAGIENPQRAL